MSFVYERRYAGPIQALIFDWAGTLVDYGSLAPIFALRRLFEENGVPVSVAEARAPMGAEKWLHIQALCSMDGVKQRWEAQHGSAAKKADIDRLYEQYLPMQLETIAERTELISGVPAVLENMRRQGIKLGTNTGYSRPMLEPILAAAAQQGFVPDSSVCATEVQRGRPYPFMSFRNMMEMEIESVAACVKIDDTATGIEEGLNAGMWTVAVAVSGNETGLSEEDWRALPEAEQISRAASAHRSMQRCGAHYVLDSVADLAPVIEEIEMRMRAGERP